jgi:tetratricopeptide (TPR) repeat protein
MNSLFTFCFIWLSIVIYSCHGQEKNLPPSDCIELNNKGTDYLMRYHGEKDLRLDSAISFLKQALVCDSTYLKAYMNIALAYDYKQDYNEELITYNKILLLTKNYPTIMVEKGIVLEKMHKLDSAVKTYKLAGIAFNKQLLTHPKNLNLIGGSILLLALTEGKESALKELDKQVSANPELASKMASDYFFYQNFNKNAFMYHLNKDATLTNSIPAN